MYRDPFENGKKLADTVGNIDALLAMVPFVRNLADYCGFEMESEKLTSLLHIKKDSDTVTLGDIIEIYTGVLNGGRFGAKLDLGTPVLPLMHQTARQIVDEGEIALDLEKKVILSIAIRLLAERIMIKTIDDDEFLCNIRRNQTATLTRRFKEVVAGTRTRRNSLL